jgi:hypothetical protein
MPERKKGLHRARSRAASPLTPNSTKRKSTFQSKRHKVRNAIRETVRRISGRKRAPRASVRRKPLVPRTAEQFFAMPPKLQDRWNSVTHAITDMRTKGLSLPEAARANDITPKTVVRLGGSALRKAAHGRYKAKASDRLLRVMAILTREGTREVPTRDSRQASLTAEHWNAVQKYLQTGDDKTLRKLRRKTIIDARGKRIRLLTDTYELDRLGSAGVLSFESLYAKAG